MGARSVTTIMTDLSIATRDYILPGIVYQIIESNYLAKRLLGKSEGVGGGDRIRVDLEVSKETINWLSEWDKVVYAPTEILDVAYYDWKWLNGSIVLSEKQVRVQNTGKEALFNIVKTKSKNLARTFKQGFGELLFKNAAAGSNQPVTLYDVIVNNTGTLAGINPSVDTYWKAKKMAISDVTYDQWMDPAQVYYIEAVMRAMYGALTNDSEHPTLIVTTQAIFDDYEMILHTQNRYSSNSSVDGAFERLKFRGAQMVVDSNVPAGHMYFLNENYLMFKHSSAINFEMGPFEKVATGQHAYASELDWWGAFVCTNRAYQGVVTGIPVTTISITP